MATQPLWFQLSPLSNLFYLFFFRLRFITSFCPYPSTSPHPHLWPVLRFQLFTQSRSWWIFHTQPTEPPTPYVPKSHQRSWWIVHTQPTAHPARPRCLIRPTQLVESFILSLQRQPRAG